MVGSHDPENSASVESVGAAFFAGVILVILANACLEILVSIFCPDLGCGRKATFLLYSIAFLVPFAAGVLSPLEAAKCLMGPRRKPELARRDFANAAGVFSALTANLFFVASNWFPGQP